jgi:hypothetical protein
LSWNQLHFTIPEIRHVTWRVVDNAEVIQLRPRGRHFRLTVIRSESGYHGEKSEAAELDNLPSLGIEYYFRRRTVPCQPESLFKVPQRKLMGNELVGLDLPASK